MRCQTKLHVHYPTNKSHPLSDSILEALGIAEAEYPDDVVWLRRADVFKYRFESASAMFFVPGIHERNGNAFGDRNQQTEPVNNNEDVTKDSLKSWATVSSRSAM